MTIRVGSGGAGAAAPLRIVVMGVSGSGKSTVGVALAARLAAGFVEADALHDEAARAKMAGGTPLTDEDRLPWLARVATAMNDAAGGSRAVVAACSALRRTYRDAIRRASTAPVVFAHLELDRGSLQRRMRAREHFMPVALLDSQRATLEPLAPDEPGFAVDASLPVAEIVEAIAAHARRA